MGQLQELTWLTLLTKQVDSLRTEILWCQEVLRLNTLRTTRVKKRVLSFVGCGQRIGLIWTIPTLWRELVTLENMVEPWYLILGTLTLDQCQTVKKTLVIPQIYSKVKVVVTMLFGAEGFTLKNICFQLRT